MQLIAEVLANLVQGLARGRYVIEVDAGGFKTYRVKVTVETIRASATLSNRSLLKILPAAVKHDPRG